MPDITRLFKGVKMDFEVEVVFADDGDQSPLEAHDYEEVVVMLEGSCLAELDGKERLLKPYDLVVVPAGVEHIWRLKSTPSKMIVIHPKLNP